jgi:ABC-type multidrug transport system ATPase subunit/pSer/pThr/pTyr-binding forkhead associated (FHA) protein
VNLETQPNCALCGKRLGEPDSSTPPLGSDYVSTTGESKHWLIGVGGEFADKRFDISASGFSVGRHPQQNKIVCNDPEVSRIHARLALEDGKVVLEDSSANGTYVNDTRVQKVTLHDGDTIRFGLSSNNTFHYSVENLISLKAKASAVSAGVVPPAPRPSGGTGPLAPVEPSAPGRGQTMYAGPVKASLRAQTVHLNVEDATLITRGSLQLVLDQYAVENIALSANRMKLGRAPGGPDRVQIEHPTVSDNHAEITASPAGATLRDLGSNNGTYVNGQRISERLLADGDVIQLGNCDTKLLLYRHPKRRVLVLRDLELRKPVVTLGRDPTNDIRLDHPTVSRQHAEIKKVGAGFEIVDKNSDNGTFVNGMKVKKQALNPRDKITLGAVQLVFDGSSLEQQSDGTRVRLVANHLTRVVNDHHSGRPLTLLDDISVVIEPREFVGLLGPVGSGKSTLMYALNGFQPADNGRVLLNNASLYDEFEALRSIIGYVPQDDIVHKTLTVRECLYYAGRLRLPDDSDEREIRTRVNEVVELLDIGERMDVAVGELSGGQRKRVSVAIELLSKPSLLFLDEPTAGQDPRTEMRMMQLFRQIANRGNTVVITTHLLGSFSLLDKIAVLMRGKLAYYGPGPEMLNYFQTSRPQEVYDKLREREPEYWGKKFRESELYKEYVTSAAANGDGSARRSSTRAPREETHSPIRQLATLVSRQFVAKFKEWQNIAGMLVPPVAIALLTSLITKGANDAKALLMIVFAGMWFGCSSSVREIVDEVSIYRRERQRGLSMLSYLGSKLVYFGAIAIGQSALFVTVLTMMGSQSNHYLGAILMMWIMTMQGVLIGLLISSLAKNADWALYIFPLALIPQLLLAGLLVPVEARHPFAVVKAGPEVHCLQPAGSQGYCKEASPGWMLAPEMNPVLRYGASPFMAARWGLEALTDMYVHDYTDGPNPDDYRYSFQDLGAVYITFHDDDERFISDEMDKLVTDRVKPGELAARDSVLAPYLMVLFGFAVTMILLTMAALKRKDYEMTRL